MITVAVSITPPAMNNDTNVMTRLRLSNTENGTIGCSAVRSTSKKATRNTTAAMPAPITHGSTQPRGGPCVNTSTAEVQASVASDAPATSSFSRSWCVSASRVTATQMMRMPIGMLIRNASRHETTVSAPPSTRPSTEPEACMAADTANARLRA